MQRIIKGDLVRVIAGKFKNKEGNVLAVYPRTRTVLVEGINKQKKHTKANKENSEGGIVEKEAPLHLHAVTLVNSKTKNVYTKVGYIFDKNNKKIRIDRKTQAPVARPK